MGRRAEAVSITGIASHFAPVVHDDGEQVEEVPDVHAVAILEQFLARVLKVVLVPGVNSERIKNANNRFSLNIK